MLVNYLKALKQPHTLENWDKFSILYFSLAVFGELNKVLRIYDDMIKWISSVKRQGVKEHPNLKWNLYCPKKSQSETHADSLQNMC